MSEIKNGRSLYGAEHSKCNHVMTPGSKWLNFRVDTTHIG